MQNYNQITNEIIEAITDKKGKRIAVIDLSAFESASTDKFIICQGSSTSQVSAIADSIRERINREAHIKPFNYEGYKNSQWIVLDYGNIMVHVFLPDIRSYYNLEDLWNDAPIEYLKDED